MFFSMFNLFLLHLLLPSTLQDTWKIVQNPTLNVFSYKSDHDEGYLAYLGNDGNHSTCVQVEEKQEVWKHRHTWWFVKPASPFVPLYIDYLIVFDNTSCRFTDCHVRLYFSDSFDHTQLQSKPPTTERYFVLSHNNSRYFGEILLESVSWQLAYIIAKPGVKLRICEFAVFAKEDIKQESRKPSTKPESRSSYEHVFWPMSEHRVCFTLFLLILTTTPIFFVVIINSPGALKTFILDEKSNRKTLNETFTKTLKNKLKRTLKLEPTS